MQDQIRKCLRTDTLLSITESVTRGVDDEPDQTQIVAHALLSLATLAAQRKHAQLVVPVSFHFYASSSVVRCLAVCANVVHAARFADGSVTLRNRKSDAAPWIA